MSALSRVVPGEVVVVEATGEDREAPLAPAEEAAISRAVASRRAEFRAGRAAAHRALARLDRPVGEIPVGPQRGPVWPDGVIGSITHCDGFCAAAVARTGSGPDGLRGLGIDAEVAGRLTDDLAHLVSSGAERRRLAALPHRPGADWATALFSTKESIYKAVEPITGVRLDFADVELALAPGGSVVVVQLSQLAAQAVGRSQLVARFAFSGDHVLSAAWLVGARTVG